MCGPKGVFFVVWKLYCKGRVSLACTVRVENLAYKRLENWMFCCDCKAKFKKIKHCKGSSPNESVKFG